MELVVAITGASGAVYGLRCIEALSNAGIKQNVIISDAAAQVIKHETGLDVSGGATDAKTAVAVHLGVGADSFEVYDVDDLMAPFCSGSYVIDGMIVIPCSMSTLARINQGIAANLILRSADVMLKERRKLVLVARETPLSLVHLRNMLQLTQAGGIIVPAMPAFYHRPESIDDVIDFVVGKTLDQFGIDHGLFRRFEGV